MFRSVLAALLLLNTSHALAQEEPASQPASTPGQGPASQPAPPPETAPEPVSAPADARDERYAAPAAELAEHEAEDAPGDEEGAGLLQEDVPTRAEIFRRGSFRLQVGGVIQVQSAFYVGDEAALAYDDPADTEGFRIRRARFGFGGTLLKDWSFYLAVDLKDAVVASQGGDQGNEILDAKIEWRRFPFARVVVGMDKVPFSAFSLQSSSRLVLIERPLMTGHLAPDRRVGLMVAGDVWRLQYAAGFYNGSDGVTSGNRMAGLSGAGYLQLNLLGQPTSFVPRKLRISLAGGYMYEDGPAVNSHRAGASLQVQGWKTRLVGEYLWMQTSPDTQPSAGSVVAGDASRWGVAGELSAFVWKQLIQVAVRYEYYRDVEDLPTFGSQQLISAGLNIYLYRDNIKLQINYINRDEREGPKVENDIGFAQLQAMF